MSSKIDNPKNIVVVTRNGKYLTYNTYKNNLNRILDAIAVKDNLTTHSLRHTFIFLLVNDDNCDIATVASLVGHSDIKVTLRYASHTDKEKKKETIRNMTELLG